VGAAMNDAINVFGVISPLVEYLEFNEGEDLSPETTAELTKTAKSVRTLLVPRDDIVIPKRITDLVNLILNKQNSTYPALSGNAGYVYLIQSVTGFYKIGKTKDVENRAKMFSVKLPFEIELDHVIRCSNRHVAERVLHDRFADKRINGEWFALAPQDVAWIKSIETDGQL
jgi:hypothetical protein